MSGVLQRLVGRATGQVSEGLQPRLPARFESATREPGLNEIRSEESPAPSPPAASEPEVSTPLSRRAHAPAIDAPAEPMQPPAAPVEGTFPSTPTEVHVAGQPIDHAPPPADLEAAAPAPLLPQIAAMQTFSAETPHRESTKQIPGGASQVLNAETVPVRPDPPRSPPEPLLPADTAASPLEAPAIAPATPRTEAAPIPDNAEPPEITIHIGRLDIRTEAQKPSPPKRPATQPRAMPSLSDYLRGSGK